MTLSLGHTATEWLDRFVGRVHIRIKRICQRVGFFPSLFAFKTEPVTSRVSAGSVDDVRCGAGRAGSEPSPPFPLDDDSGEEWAEESDGLSKYIHWVSQCFHHKGGQGSTALSLSSWGQSSIVLTQVRSPYKSDSIRRHSSKRNSYLVTKTDLIHMIVDSLVEC